MHSEFEPSSAFKQPDFGTAPGGGEMSSSALSSRFDMTGADISSAHQYFQPSDLGGAFGSGPSLDASVLTTPITGAEVPALATPGLAPGGDAALAGVLAGVNEPISPIVQIIMRMPGAMGLMNSFFEFLANFFLNPMGMFNMLDPTFVGHQVAGAISGLTTHNLPITFSLMPAVGNMSGLANPMFSSDLLSTKLNISLAHSTSNLGSPSNIGFDGSGTLDASGIDPGKPLYEGAPAGAVCDPHGGILAGPGMSDTAAGSHIAGNTRLFSDQLAGGGGSGFNAMNLATKTPSTSTLPTGLSASNLSGSGTGFGMAPQSLGQMGSPLARAGSMPAIGQLNDSVMPTTLNASNNTLNPLSGSDSLFAAPEAAKFDTTFSPSAGSDLGGNQQLIAMDNGAGMSDMGTKVAMDQPFRPTIGASNGQTMLDRSMGVEPQGLKAQQLSLDSLDKSPASDNYSAITKPSTLPANTTPLAPKTASTTGLPHGSNVHGSTHGGGTLGKAPAAHKPIEAKHAASSDLGRGHFIKSAPRNTHAVEAQAEPVNQAAAEGVEGTDVANGAADGVTDAPAETVSYTIERGDCLWNIAKEHMGDGLKWQEIYELNQNVLGSNPDLIYPGTTIQLPGGGTEIASFTAGAEHYIVKPGDNLWDISREHLGGGTHWGELYKANQDIIGANPRLIHPGQDLTLPGTGDPTSVAQVDPSAAQADPTAQAVEVDPTMENGGTTGGDALSNDAPAGDLHSDASSINQGTMQNGFSDYARQQPAGLPTSSLPQSQSMPLGHSAPTSLPQANPVAHAPAASSASHIGQAASHSSHAVAHAAPAVHNATSAAHAAPASHSAQVANHAPTMNSQAAAAQAPAQMIQQDPQNVFSPSISQTAPAPNVSSPVQHSAMSKGLPVIPANSQPVPGGPDAAQAATPHSNNATVSSSLFADLQNFLKNRK